MHTYYEQTFGDDPNDPSKNVTRVSTAAVDLDRPNGV